MSTPAVILLLCTGVLPVLLDQLQPLVMGPILTQKLSPDRMGNRRYEAPSIRVQEEPKEQTRENEAAVAPKELRLNVVHPKWPKKVKA